MVNKKQYRQHKWQNFWLTLALFGGLLSLTGLMGYVLMGISGLIWAGLIGAFALYMSTRIPAQIIMRMQKGRLLSGREAPQLYQLVKELSQRANLPKMPKLYYIPQAQLNAFATGNKKDPAIALTHGLIQQLNARELSGVIAHEISHIVNNDLQLKMMVNTMGQATRTFALIGQFLLFINLPMLLFGEAPFPWFLIALLLFAPALNTLMILAFSRTREFEADLGAAQLTGDPLGLAQALQKLNYINEGGWISWLRPVRQIFIPPYLRTHPTTKERVEKLKALAPKMKPLIRFPEELFVRWMSQGLL